MVPEGRCKSPGCNVSWKGIDGYLKCKGCHIQGCKIANEYDKRQEANARIETEKVLRRLTNNQNNNKEKEIRIYTEEEPINAPYIPEQGEQVVTKDVPPVLGFRLVK